MEREQGPLRILMLAPSYAPRLGGVEKHIRMVVRELGRMGFEVRVATPRWEGAGPECDLVDGTEVARLSPSGGEARRALGPLVGWADVVHAHDAYPFLKYYLPYRFTQPGLPTFVTFHGYEGYPIPLEARALRRIVLWLTRGHICAGAFIPKWYRFRCTHVTHGGVETPEVRPPLGRGAAFVGRLEPDTGFVQYLEALRILQEEHGISLPLAVCGDGSLRQEGARLAREWDVPITFHGRVDDVTPYLVQARFACVSGLLAMLEAMASGAIVLALYDNPLKEDYLRLFPGAAHAIVAGSAAELAHRTADLAASEEQQERLAEEAFDFAKTQTWRAVAELYVDLYRSIGLHGGER